MLPLAGTTVESPGPAKRESKRTAQTRGQQQTCEQCKTARLGLDTPVSDFCRCYGKKRPVELCAWKLQLHRHRRLFSHFAKCGEIARCLLFKGKAQNFIS